MRLWGTVLGGAECRAQRTEGRTGCAPQPQGRFAELDRRGRANTQRLTGFGKDSHEMALCCYGCSPHDPLEPSRPSRGSVGEELGA